MKYTGSKVFHSHESSQWVLSNGNVHVVAEQRSWFFCANFMLNLDREILQ